MEMVGSWGWWKKVERRDEMKVVQLVLESSAEGRGSRGLSL